MDLGHLYTIIIYQPFLNILVGIYWLLQVLSQANPSNAHPFPADMGVAVIIFTIVLRFIMLPLTFSAERSEKERKELEEKVDEIEHRLAGAPVQMDKEIKKVLNKNRRIVISAIIDLAIQVIVAVMLWRIFARGLLGEDLHMIYGWMPNIPQPFNLVFLGKYDLTHPHMSMNILQSLLILVLEIINSLASPYRVSRKEVVRMQFTLPIVSFIIFAFLPAGKKLFVITALCFSIVYSSIRLIRLSIEKMFSKPPVVEGVVAEVVGDVSKSGPQDHVPHQVGSKEQHK